MAAYDAGTAKPMSKSEKEKILAKAKACFKAANAAEQEQRIREKEDLAFQVPENQWDPEAKRYRQGTATSPGRPMLSVSLLSQPMALIQNQAVAAHLGVEIHPVSETADKETAEVKQGLYRRIERDSNAQLARLWALDRAKQAGRGWYRVGTQWDEDGDDEFDQEIVIDRIWDQSSVFMDPSAVKPDCSDAKWAMVVTYLTVEDFEELYPDAEVPLGDESWKAWEADSPEWVKNDGASKAVLVAEYFYKVPTKTELKRKVKGQTLTRQKEEIKVRRCVLSCREVLEEGDWNGQYIPLIPVIGTELQPYDGERRWEGMVRKARDAQKFANYALSTLVEVMAQEPKSPWVMAEGQVVGHEEEWALANVRNQPYLEYVPVTLGEAMAPPPQRAQADTSKLQMSMMAFGQGRDLVQSATAIYDPSLGRGSGKSEESGKKVIALQQQADAGSSHFLQNLANISMPYEARVVLDLMPAIYDRPGRVVRVLGGEDDERAVMLNRPYIENQGQPLPVDELQQAGVPMPEGAKVKEYNLAGGKYSVSVSVGKSFQTRLQEGASEIGQLLPNLPPPLQIAILPTFMRFRDFPGAKEISEIVKKVRAKEMPGLEGEEDGKPSPEQMQGQIQQMGEALKAMEAQLKGAVQEIETEQAKQQAAMMKAQLDAQTRMGEAQLEAETKRVIAAADNATKLEIASLGARVDEMLTILKVQADAYKINLQAAHDDEQAELAREHDVVKGELGRPAPEKPEPTEEE